MTDVTDRMQNYRECVRHIWNAYFRAEVDPQRVRADPPRDWDLRDRFLDAALILFKAMVLRGLDVDDAGMLPDYHGDQEPLMFLRLEVGMTSEIHVNRTGSSGYWDDPINVAEKGDFDLRFIQLFDWDAIGVRDFQFYRVRIVGSSRYPHLVGRDALVPVRDSVKVFCGEDGAGPPSGE